MGRVRIGAAAASAHACMAWPVRQPESRWQCPWRGSCRNTAGMLHHGSIATVTARDGAELLKVWSATARRARAGKRLQCTLTCTCRLACDAKPFFNSCCCRKGLAQHMPGAGAQGRTGGDTPNRLTGVPQWPCAAKRRLEGRIRS